MANLLLNEKRAILILCIAILVLIFVVYDANNKMTLVLKANEDITSNLRSLNMRITELRTKMMFSIESAEETSSQLETLRNKLTQERLKNAQLLEAIERLESSVSGVSNIVAPEEPVS